MKQSFHVTVHLVVQDDTASDAINEVSRQLGMPWQLMTAKKIGEEEEQPGTLENVIKEAYELGKGEY
jgi:hypothetical protein